VGVTGTGAETYLDWNATTPPHPDVVEAMRAALHEAWGNPSSVHRAGRRARSRLDAARAAVGALLQVDARDLVFTSGGTEANNLALHSAVGVALSRTEHPSVVRVAEALASRGVPVEWIAVTAGGRLPADALRASLRRLPTGSIAAVSAANHETGVIQPLPDIAEAVHAVGGRLHVDAVQGVGKLDASHWRGADTIAVSAHKIRGPKGIGALAWRCGAVPQPLLRGGAQQRGLRAGTLDSALCAGFGVAARWATESVARYAAVRDLRDRWEAAVTEWGNVNGAEEPRLPHVSNVSVSGWLGDELVAALDLEGVCVSSGSACSAGSSEVSPVVEEMLGRERARTAIRVSLGDETSAADVDRAIGALHRVLARNTSSG
jgi:cysteine desulfurase